MRPRRTTTSNRPHRRVSAGPLDLFEELADGLICGTIDTLTTVGEETAGHLGYLGRKAGQKVLSRIERAVRRRGRG